MSRGQGSSQQCIPSESQFITTQVAFNTLKNLVVLSNLQKQYCNKVSKIRKNEKETINAFYR